MQIRTRSLCGLLAIIVLSHCGCVLLRRDSDRKETYEETRRKLAEQQKPYDVQQASFDSDVVKQRGNGIKDIGKTVKQLTGNGPDAAKAQELMAEANKVYLQATETTDVDEKYELYVQAAETYLEAASWWPDTSTEQDAMFFAGEAYFFADQLPKANDTFQKLLKKYPNSRYLDTIENRRFKVAQYWLEVHQKDPRRFYSVNFTDDSQPRRDTYGNALKIFDGIRIDDPTGRLADDATMAAGNANFQQQKWVKALEYYEDLIKTFPNSEHQFNAHFLGLKACLESYEGPDYSEGALDRAERLIKQMRKQFPRESQEQEKFIAESYARVRYLKAEREWKLGEYYARRREFGAARMHHQRVIDNFGDVQQFADKARERIKGYADEPPVPPNRFEFLTEMFPRGQPQGPLFATGPSASKKK